VQLVGCLTLCLNFLHGIKMKTNPEISNFPVTTCNFPWFQSPCHQCQQLSLVSVSVRKNNWISNQEMIWLQLNVINIMVWTKVCEVFFLNNSNNFHYEYDNGLMGFLVISITDERRYPSSQQGTAA
jgi:hypothetical protein